MAFSSVRRLHSWLSCSGLKGYKNNLTIDMFVPVLCGFMGFIINAHGRGKEDEKMISRKGFKI